MYGLAMTQPSPRAASKSMLRKANAAPALPLSRDPLGKAATAAPSPEADIQALIGRTQDFRRDLLARAAPEPDGFAAAIAALASNDANAVAVGLDALTQRLQRPRDPALIDRLKNCESHGNPRVRLWYAQSFAGAETDAEIALMIRLAADPDRDVRDEAIRALAGSPMDTPALRDALAAAGEDRDWESFDLRLAAIQGLAARDDPRAAPAIELVLETDPLHLIGWDERLPSVCALVSAHPQQRYLPRLEGWRQRLLGSPDECEEAWIEPVLEAIETCKAADAPVTLGQTSCG
jgi:hypothetical protein